MLSEFVFNQPIGELGLSHEFVEACKKMSLYTIADVLALTPGNLSSREGFSMHWLNELVGFLEQHNVEHLLHEPKIRGKSPC